MMDYLSFEGLKHFFEKISNKFASKESVSDLQNLVGDTSVIEQINTAAINNQADWSINDEISPAYVKNRTHWEESYLENYFPETTVTIAEDNGGISLSDNYDRLEEGVKYLVTFDGTEYSCIARKYRSWILIGNGEIDSDDGLGNGEPFAVASYSYGGLSLYTTSAGDHTISIVKNSIAVHTIDEKFISYKPGRIVTGETFTVYNSDDTEEEVVAAEYAEIFNKENVATGMCSHAEGIYCSATGDYSHAEGNLCRATGSSSHAEGCSTTASMSYAHAEGRDSIASGYASHAEGDNTIASGFVSHAEGRNTIAASANQHVQGRYNIEDTAGVYAHIVGNSYDPDNRSNAHTLDWSGNAWFSGDVYVGSTSGTNKDDGSKVLATQEYINTAMEDLATVASTGSWNDLEDKPFYAEEDQSLTLDGNVEGLTCVTYAEVNFYKVSDYIPELSQVIGQPFSDTSRQYVATEDLIYPYVYDPAYMIGYSYVVVPEDNFIISSSGVVFPEKGLYAASDVRYIGISPKIKYIDEIVIPDTIARKEDIPSDMLSIDLTDVDQGTATGINADTLGGVAADGYVLETELDIYKNEVSSEINEMKNEVSNDMSDLEVSVSENVTSISNLENDISNLESDIKTNYVTKTEVNENYALKSDLPSDSGWIDMTLSSSFELYSSTDAVAKYRKIGNMVQLCGQIKPTATITATLEGVTITTLPSGYRPSYTIFCLQQGSGVNKWLLIVNAEGKVTFSRYGISATADAATNVWLPFSCTFFVD